METRDAFKAMEEERYAEYISDITLANRVMSEQLVNVSEKEVLCDLYAIPSHNHQAFYVKIYKREQLYYILYAKPIFSHGGRDEEIYMYPFRDSLDARALNGKIVCGVKPLDNNFVDNLITKLECLPEKQILGCSKFILDGVFQSIRVFNNGEVIKEVIYNDAEDIVFKTGFDVNELKWYFASLYMMIEKIIGRGDSGCKMECSCAQYAIGSEMQAIGAGFVGYKKVPMGQLYKCPYCNTFWAKYHPGFGWRSYFKESDDAGASEAVPSSGGRVEVDAEKLQSLKKSILAMLKNIPVYNSEDDWLVERLREQRLSGRRRNLHSVFCCLRSNQSQDARTNTAASDREHRQYYFGHEKKLE